MTPVYFGMLASLCVAIKCAIDSYEGKYGLYPRVVGALASVGWLCNVYSLWELAR